MNTPVATPKVKAALAEVIRRKDAIQDLVSKRQQFEQQVTVVDQEQNRIRQNMAQLDRTSDLYNRYVKKFGEQEDQVDGLRKQIQGLQSEEAGVRKSLDQYLETLDLS
jgi:polyhydroxyalkanoate synthesis regulator phasin